MENKYISGDLVMYNGKVYTIEKVLDNTCVELAGVIDGIFTYDIKPILFTSTILEKNGWEHIKEVYWKDYPNLKLVINNGVASVINEQCSLYLRQVDYVHQFQHLLFGLGLDSNIIV